MRHHYLLLATCTLLTTTACGSGKSGGDDGPSEPLSCFVSGDEYEDGDQFDSPEGCVTYVCNDGALTVLTDRRVTVPGDLELSTQAAVDEQLCLGQVEGQLLITGEAADLTPLGRLYRVGEGLEIVGSEAETLAGLEGLTEVGGAILIASNESLTRLSFNPTMSAFGDVTIDDNDALVQLSALGNLYYAWADVRFRNNAALAILDSLALMEVRGVLEISEHPLMSTVDAQALADGMSVLGELLICGNLDGQACPQ